MTSYQSIVERFNKNHINISSDWLNSNNNINSYTDYYNLFLNSELKDSCIGQGTANSKELITVERTTLFEKGTVLELIDIIDISRSLFQQVEQLKGIEEVNESEELDIKSTQAKVNKHYFKLTLTDGKNEFIGFENNTINSLKLDMPLGTKIEIKNVVTIRGVMMLDSKNCKVLGGRVNSLNLVHPILRFGRKLRGADYVDNSYYAKLASQQSSTPSVIDLSTPSIVEPSIPLKRKTFSNCLAESVNTASSIPNVSTSTIATSNNPNEETFDPFEEFDDSFVEMVVAQDDPTIAAFNTPNDSNTTIVASNNPSASTPTITANNNNEEDDHDPFGDIDDSFIDRIAAQFDNSKSVINLTNDEDDDDAFQ